MTKRLALDTVVSLALAASASIVAFLVAPMLFARIASWAAVPIVVTSQSEVLWARVGLAWPWPVAIGLGWIATLVERVLRRAAPPPWRVALLLAFPLAAALARLVLELALVRTVLDPQLLGDTSVSPMVSLSDLDLGSSPAAWASIAGVVECGIVAAVAARARAPR